MPHERKRTGEQGSLSSGRAAYSASPRGAPAYAQYRSESPPASAYFSHFPGQDHELHQTTPDAYAHFAYSTTLRRHTAEGPSAPMRSAVPSMGELRTAMETEGVRGVWDRTGGRLLTMFSGREQHYEHLPARREEGQKESASARFAHCSIQVRCNSKPNSHRPSLTPRRTRLRTSAHRRRMGYPLGGCKSSCRRTATTSSPWTRPNHCSSSSRRRYTRTRSSYFCAGAQGSAQSWAI